MDDEELGDADTGRKHRRRGVAMVTSESFDNLRPEWEALHRSIGHADQETHPEAFGELSGSMQMVWLSVRGADALIGVVVFEVGGTGARLAATPDRLGLLVKPGSESMLAEGILEWLWEDMTEALAIGAIGLSQAMSDAFLAAGERLGWRSSKSSDGSTVKLSQRR